MAGLCCSLAFFFPLTFSGFRFSCYRMKGQTSGKEKLQAKIKFPWTWWTWLAFIERILNVSYQILHNCRACRCNLRINARRKAKQVSYVRLFALFLSSMSSVCCYVSVNDGQTSRKEVNNDWLWRIGGNERKEIPRIAMWKVSEACDALRDFVRLPYKSLFTFTCHW